MFPAPVTGNHSLCPCLLAPSYSIPSNDEPRPLHCSHAGRKKADDDDDDFVVPDDIEEEDEDAELSSSRGRSSSRASSRRSSHSSALSELDSDFDDDDIGEPKSKTKTKTSASKKSSAPTRPPLKQESSSNPGPGGSSAFLTAAEQRALKQRSEKKAAEDPFGFLVDVRDKDGVRPGEPGYDPRTLYIPKSAWNEFTPFEKQFWEIKQNHFDTILFFQKGKFLELYEEDARIGHQEFDLKLTQRVKMSMVRAIFCL